MSGGLYRFAIFKVVFNKVFNVLNLHS